MDRSAMDDERGSYGPWHAVERYQPCFELASGGMGTVFLARVTARAALHRFVALKRIHPHLVKEPGFVEMFLDEAYVASRIVHPHVCSVLDFDVEGGRPYIAMEYLMGEPLTRVAQALARIQQPAEVERASRLVARVVADACEGLHAAHELQDAQGEPLHVVHRDVSPQNLFLTYDGAVKVVDFGLVRMAQCLHKTKTGIIKGKFAYLAPEVVATRPLDRRADVWGLGVVLWEMLTGERLFQRATEVDTVVAVANAEIPPPSTVHAGIPPEVDAIVLHALARRPDDRYATARALGRDLAAFVHCGAEPVGLSDVAEWTERLFPRGRERKLELLEIAGQMLSERPSSRPPPGVRASHRPPASGSWELELPTRAWSNVPPACSTPPCAPARTPERTSERPAVSSGRPALPPPPPASSDLEVPVLACSTVPLACSTPASAPAHGPRWATRGAALTALALAVFLAGFALARRGAATAATPSALPEASPTRSVALPARIALQRAGVSSQPATEAGGPMCMPGGDTMVLELIPEGESQPRRILVRAVAQPALRP